jgi:REP element-mobilizing transposase RayT
MPGYFDRYMRDQDHVLDTVAYILNNPVKAGLAKAPEEWPWSGGFWLEENDGKRK